MSAPGLLSRMKTSLYQSIQTVMEEGSVEGVLYIDGHPAPAGIPVGCVYMCVSKEGWFSEDGSVVKTDRDGRFKFWFVPPGEAGVGRCFPDRPGCPSSVERRVEVRAGETTQVDLGCGSGRIVGRFKIPEPYAEFISWAELPSIWLQCERHASDAPIDRVREYSGEWRGLGHDEDATNLDHQRWYLVPVDAMGSFDICGVLPGVYAMRFTIPSVINDGMTLLRPWCMGFHMFNVPHASMGRQHIDLGVLELPKHGLSMIGTARIEGQLYIDGKPAPRGTVVGCNVEISFHDEFEDLRLNRSGYLTADDKETRTDREGRFVFNGVQIGDATIGRLRVEGDLGEPADDDDLDSQGIENDPVKLKLERGKTHTVVIGNPQAGDAVLS